MTVTRTNQPKPTSGLAYILGGAKPYPNVNFDNDGPLVQRGRPLEITWPLNRLVPAILPVRLGQAAVVCAGGVTRTYPAGPNWIADLPPGRYEVHYVDMQQRRLLMTVSGNAADTWPAAVKISVPWQVHRPSLVIGIKDPLANIGDACRAAVLDVIQSLEHDALYTDPTRRSLPSQVIARAIEDRLHAAPALSAFTIQGVSVQGRQGDDRRNQVYQQAAVETARLESDRQVLREQAHTNAVDFQLQATLVDLEREVRLKEAQTIRLRDAELDRLRVDEALTSTRAAAHGRPAELQAIEMQNRSQAQQLEFELQMETLRQRGGSLQGLSEAIIRLTNGQGITPIMSQESLVALQAMLRELTQGTSVIPQIERAADPGPDGLLATAPVELLFAQLRQLSGNNYVEDTRLEPIGGALCRAIVEAPPFTLTALCGPEYPERPPREVWLIQDGQYTAPDLQWAPAMGLEDLFASVVEPQFKPKKAKGHKNGRRPKGQSDRQQPAV